VTCPEPADRTVLDLDDPEQLAEAVMLGVVQAFEVSAARLARLGQAHAELLARQRTTADHAQAALNELEAARAEIAALRSLVVERLHSISGLARAQGAGPEVSDLLLVAALALAPDPHSVIGLLLSASTNACLLAERPRGALQAGMDIFRSALADVERAMQAAEPATEPS